jgi:hypothetical protein
VLSDATAAFARYYGGAQPGDDNFADVVAVDGEIVAVIAEREQWRKESHTLLLFPILELPRMRKKPPAGPCRTLPPEQRERRRKGGHHDDTATRRAHRNPARADA